METLERRRVSWIGLCGAKTMKCPFCKDCSIPLSAEDVQRFWSKVIKTDGCWEWTGTSVLMKGGRRPVFSIHGRNSFAYRISWEIHNAREIPDGLVIDHLCNNPMCVNPAHLRACTQEQNNARSTSATAINGRKTCCKYGHPFDEKNTYMRPDGTGRACRTCEGRSLLSDGK